MRAKVLMALATVAAMPVLFIAATAAPASAHVLKTVGPYHLLIGFGNEPTYAGAQNSVFLLLTSAKTGGPILDEGLGDTLKVQVGFGTQTKLLPLVSSFDPDRPRRLHLPFLRQHPHDKGEHHREVVADDVRQRARPRSDRVPAAGAVEPAAGAAPERRVGPAVRRGSGGRQ